MGSSPTLVAPGLRTAPRAGWRSGVGTALAVVAGQPSLWLLGALGFVCRGGVVLLALPLFVVPTPVEVRLLLGANLSSTGLTPSFFALLVPLGLLAALLVGAALALVAQAELASFERLALDPESTDGRDDRHPERLAAAERRRVLGWLFLIQLAALIALLTSALPLAFAIGEVTLSELIRPTPGGDALYSRVLNGVREPLFLLLPAVVIVDIVSASASRALLVRRFGLLPAERPHRGRLDILADKVARPLRRPLETVGTSLLCWTTTLLILVPAAWALDVAAEATRAAYLSPRAADPEMLPWLVIMTFVFVSAWALALLLAGFVSALRAAFWTVESLR